MNRTKNNSVLECLSGLKILNKYSFSLPTSYKELRSFSQIKQRPAHSCGLDLEMRIG